jgi:hypothetical protein
MSWTWQIDAADDGSATLDHEVPAFSSQSDAESWLGEVWRELVDAGGVQATLLEDDREVYGPMSLLPPG